MLAMTTDFPPSLMRARLQLMLAHPYLASGLARLPLVDATQHSWCPTMATDGHLIYVNTQWCAKLTQDELLSVFAHELLHCVLGHIDRRGQRERRRWNMAIDYAVNNLLAEFGFRLPATALFEPRFRGLTAEQIDDQLQTHHWSIASDFDRHLDPDESDGQIYRGTSFPSLNERRWLSAEMSRAMAQAYRNRRGNLPGSFALELQTTTSRRLSWRELLAQLIVGLRRSDYRLYPPNHKHIHRGIYLPALGVPDIEHLTLAVDTSGSMGPDQLGLIAAELDQLRAMTGATLTLIECDAIVQRVSEVESDQPTVVPRLAGRPHLLGGGGTDFCPVFDWIESQQRDGYTTSALIYCTDGLGVFPPHPPDYPVIWIATPGCTESFPFGEVIFLHD